MDGWTFPSFTIDYLWKSNFKLYLTTRMEKYITIIINLLSKREFSVNQHFFPRTWKWTQWLFQNCVGTLFSIKSTVAIKNGAPGCTNPSFWNSTGQTCLVFLFPVYPFIVATKAPTLFCDSLKKKEIWSADEELPSHALPCTEATSLPRYCISHCQCIFSSKSYSVCCFFKFHFHRTTRGY